MKITNFLQIFLFIFILFGAANSLQAQDKYWVFFTDKDDSPYHIDRPEEFLTPKAIERRKRQQIAITSQDLPVNPAYIETLKSMGINCVHPSKWFNGVSIRVTAETDLDHIEALPFVRDIELVGKRLVKEDILMSTPSTRSIALLDDISDPESWYGGSYNQINMLNGQFLHRNGFTGEGMTIAVMDAGFKKIDENPLMKTLFDGNQIIATYDFVDLEESVYENHSHGANVLTIMSGNQPTQFVGSAPDAQYYLFRTEQVSSEQNVEEDNWVAAAEEADRVGVDVINTSLGYSEFDEDQNSYTYADMDGDQTIITQGADYAASKGILVVNSAGNAGNDPWRYITAPADGDSVLAVGAVDEFGHHASFSSWGPSADGDVKPNVSAQGLGTVYIGTNGDVRAGNGTSYSSPVIAGMLACLWQALPNKTNMEIFDLVQRSSSYYSTPNDSLGYGIPNFEKALLLANQTNLNTTNNFELFPVPFYSDLFVQYLAPKSETIFIQLSDLAGRTLAKLEQEVEEGTDYHFKFNQLFDYPSGVYVVSVKTSDTRTSYKCLKLY